MSKNEAACAAESKTATFADDDLQCDLAKLTKWDQYTGRSRSVLTSPNPLPHIACAVEPWKQQMVKEDPTRARFMYVQ